MKKWWRRRKRLPPPIEDGGAIWSVAGLSEVPTEDTESTYGPVTLRENRDGFTEFVYDPAYGAEALGGVFTRVGDMKVLVRGLGGGKVLVQCWRS